MKITQVMHWTNFKRFGLSQDIVLLFRSGSFYRTYESDAKFLSQRFGFQLLQRAEYSMVGFPLSAKEKYLGWLQKEGYSFQVVEVINERLHILETFTGQNSLPDPFEQHINRDGKDIFSPSLSSVQEECSFRSFLQELSLLTQKYLS